MLCPVCYPHSSTPDRITKIYAHMSTILVQGKAHLKCHSCGVCIPQEQDQPPAPKVSDLDLQKDLVESLRAENADLKQQLRIMTAERDVLRHSALSISPIDSPAVSAPAYPAIPTATELPPAHNS